MSDLRPSLTRYLSQRLEAFQDGFRHNLALLGPLGSGKSTLLQQVLQQSNAHVTKIYCSLQRDSVREFLKRFVSAVLRSVVEAPFDAPLDALLRHAAPVVPQTTEAIQHLERYATGHLQADAFVHALDVIPILHRESQRPCVLVLDEFLHLEELNLSHAFHELGKRVMTWPFALFLLTSSSTFRAREILRERLHLLFGQFEVVSLGPIEAPVGMAWLEGELPSAKHQPTLTRFLLHWTGASPWYLSVLLTRLQESARLKRERKFTEAIIFQAAWDVLGSPDGVLHHWCAAQIERVEHQRYGVLAREALIAIAHGARTSQAVAQQCGTRRHLPQALQLLVEGDLIQRKGTCWVIPDQVLTCWLLAVLGPRRTQGLLDRPTAAKVFEQTFQSIWIEWTEASNQSMVDRMSRLLSQFRNETISLDHKTGRLPSFRAMRSHASPQHDDTYIVADGEERRWCCLVPTGKLDETSIATFEAFCRGQSPKPSRKIVVASEGLELNAKLLAQEANMWVWEPEDVNLLFLLYGQLPLNH